MNQNYSKTSSNSKKWLSKARYSRINSIIQSKADSLLSMNGNSTIFHDTVNSIDIDSSGLSPQEITILDDWYNNRVTGHQAYAAIFNHKYHNTISSTSPSTSIKPLKDIKPFDLLSLSISFPSNCCSLSKNHEIFNKSPIVVIKETLELIKEKSCEKSIKNLTIQQLNLALKQIKLDGMSCNQTSPTSREKENNPQSPEDSSTSPSAEFPRPELTKAVKQDEELNIQVLIELLRIHIKSTTQPTCDDSKTSTPSNIKQPWAWGEDIFNIATQFTEQLSPKAVSDSSSQIDTTVLETHLSTPITTIQQQSSNLSVEALESSNSVFKPYLRHLANLKGILSAQLKDLEESKAYLALGVNQDSNEKTLKKAYRNMAIKLHPDKPGGDTAKFQKLQDFYQEIMKNRESNAAIHERLEKQKLDPSYVAMIDRTQILLDELWEQVQLVQDQASKTSTLTQKHIKFMKKLTQKCDDYSSNNSDNNLSQSKKKSKTITISDIQEYCNVYQLKTNSNTTKSLISSCEIVCESSQKLSTLAMTLPSIHPRIGLLISKSFPGLNDSSQSAGFLSDIENCMTLSLNVLKCINSIMKSDHSVTQQLSTIPLHEGIIDMRYSWMKHSNNEKEKHYISSLREVYETQLCVLRTTASYMLDCAMLCSQIYAFISDVINRMDELLMEDIKKDVKEQATYQGFSEEDIEILRRHTTTSNNTPQPNSSCSMSSTDMCPSSNEKSNEEKPSDPSNVTETENKDELQNQQEKVATELSDLRSKIHNLQVKLHVQNIQIFQTLNNDVRELQTQLQGEVISVLAIESSNASNIDMMMKLLAECIDTSLSALKSSVDSNSTPFDNERTIEIEIVGLLKKHLGWMLELQGSSSITVNDLFPNHSSIDSDHESESKSCGRIALLPDYRSKALWLGSLLDASCVITMVEEELNGRIVETIEQLLKTMEGQVACKGTSVQVATRFCDMIVKRVADVRSEVIEKKK